LQASIPGLGRRFSSTNLVENNATWAYVDTTSATQLRIVPRMNNENTVVIGIVGGALDTEVATNAKVPHGGTVAIRISPTFRLADGRSEPVLQIETTTQPVDAEAFLTNPFALSQGWTVTQTQNSVIAPVESELRLLIKVEIKS
jgi:hypothetical protein